MVSMPGETHEQGAICRLNMNLTLNETKAVCLPAQIGLEEELKANERLYQRVLWHRRWSDISHRSCCYGNGGQGRPENTVGTCD